MQSVGLDGFGEGDRVPQSLPEEITARRHRFPTHEGGNRESIEASPRPDFNRRQNRQLKSRAIKGNMTPAEAAVLLLKENGLEAMPIKHRIGIGR
ncbi:hypothetical protein C1T17_13500 [Sphingobium sp. SCG-1]|uniref:hypothetical protein n=1 Tax=Sphingobium sp. SCG-1 TaxID=2072936 RepID=UPI000CD6A1C3|nr:hypothetical protein [Sphingobium sp. SCG-1]AUW58955.1 hypothetical protein C1T17_13500 [Sphingobium sp. SCG-1]